LKVLVALIPAGTLPDETVIAMNAPVFLVALGFSAGLHPPSTSFEAICIHASPAAVRESRVVFGTVIFAADW